MRTFTGIKASSGLAKGEVYLKKKDKIEVDYTKIDAVRVELEIERLEKTRQQVKRQLEEIKEKTACKVGVEEAAIFQAHLLLLDDPELIPAVKEKIRKDKFCAEFAVSKVIEGYQEIFRAMEDEYIKARMADLEDVKNRILRALSGTAETCGMLTKPVVLVAEDLSPSETAMLDLQYVKGMVTEKGSHVSHTAILARSLGIPAVVGAGEGLLAGLKEGEIVIVDGDNGKVIFAPGETVLQEYEQKIKQEEKWRTGLSRYRELETRTKDGKRVKVAGNAGGVKDVDRIIEQGGEGIGLYRTEFIFLDRRDPPSEEEQFEIYREALEKIYPREVVIRTLDIGGDKSVKCVDLPLEENPFLGYRGIRNYLDSSEIYRPQLRALIRASVYGNLKIMFPMISTLEEIRRIKAAVKEVTEMLREEEIAFTPHLELGIMIEVPSAALMAREMADEVDFFSIGSNDLIQYTMAADRINPKVSCLHSPYHPSVLRIIKMAVDAAHERRIWAGFCGEAASDLLLVPFLLGIGLDEFSVSAGAILPLKEAIAGWDSQRASELAKNILEMSTGEQVKEYLLKVAVIKR